MQSDGVVGPELTIEAFRTGVRPDRRWVSGRPTMLVFHGRDNQDAARAVVQTVRNSYPYATQVVTVNVVDLGRYPRVMRKLVVHDLDLAYEAEVDILPGDRDPESHIIIMPDHSGDITRQWGVTGAETEVTGVVLDADWQIRSRASGASVGDVMLAELRRLIG